MDVTVPANGGRLLVSTRLKLTGVIAWKRERALIDGNHSNGLRVFLLAVHEVRRQSGSGAPLSVGTRAASISSGSVDEQTKSTLRESLNTSPGERLFLCRPSSNLLPVAAT